MYQKVHLRLTLLCTCITAAIMIIMGFLFLRISENSLYENQFASFEKDIAVISEGLTVQKVITTKYLSEMKTEQSYSFFLLDNGVPFLHHQLTDLADEQGKAFLAEILSKYEEAPSTPFLFSSDITKKNYFCSVLEINRNTSALWAVILFPMDALEQQVQNQRFHFILIEVITLSLLLVFSWFFTGLLLKPILENQKQQTQFVASASHELRTPLSVILSSTECLLDTATESQHKFLHNIRQSGLSMSYLIDDMLLLSLSDSKRLPMEKEDIELDTLLIDSYEAFRPLAKEKQIKLTLSLPESAVPACYCDGKRITQVVSVLLSNAISYTQEGGCITLTLSFDEKSFFLTTADNGIGISDEDKKRIFHRFYRAEESRNTKGHFGLGLSIACEIVAAHLGSISVADAPGGGSVFTVTLPVDARN